MLRPWCFRLLVDLEQFAVTTMSEKKPSLPLCLASIHRERFTRVESSRLAMLSPGATSNVRVEVPMSP